MLVLSSVAFISSKDGNGSFNVHHNLGRKRNQRTRNLAKDVHSIDLTVRIIIGVSKYDIV